ncbi:MAG: hypothetical protein KatS3mg099_401 [Candidatus Parcubacteria bacterium]|nr:MAG: hypothetical protein KatS3mg099_401 [Candidatus Parcubacteria bacterium]
MQRITASFDYMQPSTQSSSLSQARIQEIRQREATVLRSRTFARIVQRYHLAEKRVLDIGCGFGEYMQRFGTGSVGITTTPEEVAYGALVGRDIRLGNAEKLEEVLSPSERFDAFWANNIFEHLLSPHAFLVSLKRWAHPNALLILGTPMIPSPKFLLRLKRFRGALASPHINFFTRHTYRLTVERAGWRVEYLSPFFLASDIASRLVAFAAPHLFVVARNDPTYRYPPKKIKEWEASPLYQPLLEIMGSRARPLPQTQAPSER